MTIRKFELGQRVRLRPGVVSNLVGLDGPPCGTVCMVPPQGVGLGPNQCAWITIDDCHHEMLVHADECELIDEVAV